MQNRSEVVGGRAVSGRFNRQQKAIRRLPLAAAAAVAGSLLPANLARAATITKADTNTLNNGSDWVGGIVPGAADIGNFTTTISAGNIGNLSLGGNLSWLGLTIGTVNGPAVINSGNTLTLGSSGINMSAATGNLTINSGLTLLGNESWSAASGRTLAIGGTFTHAGATVDFTNFNSGAVLTGITNDASGILGAWATTGSGTSLNYVQNTAGSATAYTTQTTATAGNLTNVTSATTNYAFGAAATTTGNLTGNTLRYTGGSATLAIGASNNITLNGLMNAGSASTLTISGGAAGGGILIGSTNELVITANTQATAISAVIANGLGGNGAVTYSGAGTITLSGNNTFSGGTTLNAGTLNIGSGSAVGNLGAGNSAVTLNGGTLNFAQSTNTTSAVFANNFVFAGGTVSYSVDGKYTLGSATALTAGTNTISVTGATTFAGLWHDKPIVLAGVVSGNGAITVQRQTTGSGSNNTAYLAFINDSSIYSGTITTIGTQSSGAGGIQIAGTNGTALQNASVVNNTVDSGSSDKGVLFDVTSVTLGSLAGTGNIALNVNSAGLAGTPNLNGSAVALTVGGNNGNTTYSGILSGSGSLTKIGNGTMTLSSINTYAGNATVSGGTLALAIGSAGNGTIRGTLTINSGAVVNLTAGDALGFSSGTSVSTVNINGGTLNNSVNTNNNGFITNFVLTGGTMSQTGAYDGSTHGYNFSSGFGITTNASAATSTISAPLSIRGGTLNFSVADGAAATDLNVSGVLVSNGGTDIIKLGSGTMQLAAANLYTGNTTIENGTLLIGAAAPSGSAGALGNSTSAIVLGDAASISGNLGVSLLTAGAFTAARNITVGANSNSTTALFTIGGNTANTSTFSGVTTLNQSVIITQVTSGALNLTGNFTSGASGTQTVTFNNAGNISQSTGIIGGGTGSIAVVQAGAGMTTLTSVNTYAGPTSVNGGILALAPASGTNNIASSKSITVGTNATFSVANVGGTGANAFALNGTGNQSTSQILGGNGTVTGAVAISNGATLSAGTNSGTGKVKVVSSPASSALLPATGSTDTIGTLTTGALTLGASSGASANLAIKVSDVPASGTPLAGAAGTNYDTIAAGAITVPSNSPTQPANPFNIQLLGYGTLASPTANTASVNFNPASTYVWQIASYTSTNIPGAANGATVILTSGGGLTAAAGVAGLFSLDTTGFASANTSITGARLGAFYLEDIGTTNGAGTLDVVYNATPEPGSAILVLAGGLPMLCARRRRRKAGQRVV